MLSDDPHNSLVLMLYLKQYSELLFSWGETVRAVQACKLVASACQLLEEYQQSKVAASKSVSGLGDDEMTMAIREDSHSLPRPRGDNCYTSEEQRFQDGRPLSTDEHPQGPNDQQVILATSSFGKGPFSRLAVTRRPFMLSDFLLFSEHSLNYVQQVELAMPTQAMPAQQHT